MQLLNYLQEEAETLFWSIQLRLARSRHVPDGSAAFEHGYLARRIGCVVGVDVGDEAFDLVVHDLNDFDDQTHPEVRNLSYDLELGQLFLVCDVLQLSAGLAAHDLCHRQLKDTHQLLNVGVLLILVVCSSELVDYQAFKVLIQILLSVNCLLLSSLNLYWRRNHILYNGFLEVLEVLLHESVDVHEEGVLLEVTLLHRNVQVLTLRVSLSLLHDIVVTRQTLLHVLRVH